MKLYVGNLPYSAREEQLRELFAPHGTLASVNVIVDGQTGRSRGFGFVEFEDSEEGQKAMAALNGADFGGRALVVNEARPRNDGFSDRRSGPRGGHGGGGGGYGRSGRGGGRDGFGGGGGRRGY